VQEAERFEPDAEEIAAAPAVSSAPSGPIEIEIAAELLTDALFEELKAVLEHHKGDAEVRVAVRDGAAEPKLFALGDSYRVRPSGRLQSELDHLLGSTASLAA